MEDTAIFDNQIWQEKCPFWTRNLLFYLHTSLILKPDGTKSTRKVMRETKTCPHFPTNHNLKSAKKNFSLFLCCANLLLLNLFHCYWCSRYCSRSKWPDDIWLLTNSAKVSKLCFVWLVSSEALYLLIHELGTTLVYVPAELTKQTNAIHKRIVYNK